MDVEITLEYSSYDLNKTFKIQFYETGIKKTLQSAAVVSAEVFTHISALRSKGFQSLLAVCYFSHKYSHFCSTQFVF